MATTLDKLDPIIDDLARTYPRTAIDAYISNAGAEYLDPDTFEDEFTEAYQGEHNSVCAYAEEYLADAGAYDQLPEYLRGYLDVDAFGRDLKLGGDIWTADTMQGVYVFHAI